MNVQKGLANGGWLIAAVVAITTLAYAAYAPNPVTIVEDEVVGPVAAAAGITQGLCPDGWKNVSDAGDHVKVQSCLKDSWHVVLSDGVFERARLDGASGDWITDPRQVPGWPR